MKYLIFPILLVATFFASCNSSKTMAKDGGSFDLTASRQELAGTEWTVERLSGKKLMAAQGRKMPSMMFLMDGKLQGNTGCNPINGMYVLEADRQIRFTKTVAGLAACSDVTYEAEFLNVLTADNYTIKNGVLSLNKGKETLATLSGN